MPASRHRSRSPASAFAVMATMGRWSPPPSSARIARVASNPFMSGSCTSMRTTSKRSRWTAATASSALRATTTVWPRSPRSSVANTWLISLSSANRIRSGFSGRVALRGRTRAGKSVKAVTMASTSSTRNTRLRALITCIDGAAGERTAGAGRPARRSAPRSPAATAALGRPSSRGSRSRRTSGRRGAVRPTQRPRARAMQSPSMACPADP
jgi:hypothetical protein